ISFIRTSFLYIATGNRTDAIKLCGHNGTFIGRSTPCYRPHDQRLDHRRHIWEKPPKMTHARQVNLRKSNACILNMPNIANPLHPHISHCSDTTHAQGRQSAIIAPGKGPVRMSDTTADYSAIGAPDEASGAMAR